MGKDTAQTLETQCTQGIAIPVLTPDRMDKQQNGRRMKEDGDPAYTVTQEPNGVAVVGGFGEKNCNKNTQWHQQDRIHRRCGLATSLSAQLPGGGQMYSMPTTEEVDTIYYPKRDCYIAIRKLLPIECFRLQGFSDDLFRRAEFVNSDSQLYKQAGNAVTVQVVEDVGKAIARSENDTENEDR